MSKPKLGITIGDINGIGPEVIIKSLSNQMLFNECTPIIYGSSKVMGYHKNIVKDPDFHFNNIARTDRASSGKVSLINCWQDSVKINLGEATEESGKCAYIALDRAVGDLNKGFIDALVTSPVNKHAMKMADFPYLGHTEYIAKSCEMAGQELMLMISDELRVAVLSSHIPVRRITERITKENIKEAITVLNDTLVQDFGLEKPTIAVLGLNPHAGDDGEIGKEEIEIIKPAIIELKKSGLVVSGPYSVDGFFGSSIYKRFDATLAMYHDQGLVPFKALSFGSGVNYTAGLPIIRTSPDHGTGYDIAGKNLADESSMRKAIYAALDICRSRKEYDDMHKSAVDKVEIESAGEIV